MNCLISTCNFVRGCTNLFSSLLSTFPGFNSYETENPFKLIISINKTGKSLRSLLAIQIKQQILCQKWSNKFFRSAFRMRLRLHSCFNRQTPISGPFDPGTPVEPDMMISENVFEGKVEMAGLSPSTTIDNNLLIS